MQWLLRPPGEYLCAHFGGVGSRQLPCFPHHYLRAPWGCAGYGGLSGRRQLSARLFTFDACANPSGDNALCAQFCHLQNNFLERDLGGENVWMNPPFGDIQAFIDHYVAQNALHPQTISAGILIPDWH